ncbi:MAG TPA: hypothetical protein VIK09_06205, partial [Candidatus Humimicrobiaceae bacterium]
LFFNVLLIIPKERAVPRKVEIVAEIKAITALFIIAFLASTSWKSSINHFQVKPLRGKLYPSLLFHANMNIKIMGANIYKKNNAE